LWQQATSTQGSFSNLWLLSLYRERDDFPRLAAGLPSEGRDGIPCSLAVELLYGGEWTLFWLAEWLPSGSGSTPVSQAALGMLVPDLQRKKHVDLGHAYLVLSTVNCLNRPLNDNSQIRYLLGSFR
jgi:hypothetical protein